MADNRDLEARDATLDHERLDAYQVAVESDAMVARLPRHCGHGHARLVEQVQEAAGSVVLNLAEGYGPRRRSRARCLEIARGSPSKSTAPSP